jgi:hypothetical protein
MQISKFIKVDVDVLLEWVYNDDDFLMEDYSIVNDTLRDTRAFSNQAKTGSQDSNTNNITDSQLFSLDPQRNKWGIVDPDPETNRYTFLQFQDYPGNVPFRYDTVRLHFPVDYTFKDKIGCLINISLFNQEQTIKFPLANYFYDKSDPNRLDLDLTAPPFLFQEKLWGKYIELQVPSPNVLINDVAIVNKNRIPRGGSIHSNLVEEDYNVLSNETPIFIDFQFLTKKEDKLSQIAWYTTEPFSTTLPTTPEFEQLGLTIQNSEEGDFFEIFGTFNGNSSEFNDFIQKGNLQGKKYYTLYEICIFEKNVKTSFQTYTQMDNFDIPIDFRPIIKYSTTTAVIDVTMKVINAVDDSTIQRRASYSMIQDEVSKYSKNLTKIDTRDTFKPKIYNAKPDQINVTMGDGLRNVEKVEVPFAVMFERFNVNVKNISESVNDTVYYGIGQLQILLYPSDNVIKFAIANGTDEDGVVPFEIPTTTVITLLFKSNKTKVEVPLFWESGEVNLAGGICVFRVPEAQFEAINTIYSEGFDQFYIQMVDNGNQTIIYPGRFLIYNAF